MPLWIFALLGIASLLYVATVYWFIDRNQGHIYQTRFLLAGSMTGVVLGATLDLSILTITLTLLPSTIVLALMLSSLLHSVFDWPLLE